MDKCKVLVPIGCRSDEGLSKPIIKRLKEDDFFDVRILNINPYNISLSYFSWFETFEDCYPDFQHWEDHWKPDLAFITGDRIEITAVAYQAFHNNVPIAHYFAGVLTDPMTNLDNLNRHCISLWSEIQFVESFECGLNVIKLFNAIGKKRNVYEVGITHLEDLEIDTSLVPKHSYDLVLYNPPTLYDFQLQKKDVRELYEIQKSIKNKAIILDPNPDPKAIFLPVTYPNLPRPQFLGLLKWCSRFITNSSSAIYEAPYFLKKEQIVMVGDRNKNRTRFTYEKTDKLASEKIVKILKDWWIDKNE